MSNQQYGPAKPNADHMWNELKKSFTRTIPRHMRNVRDAVRHMQQIRRRG